MNMIVKFVIIVVVVVVILYVGIFGIKIGKYVDEGGEGVIEVDEVVLLELIFVQC